MDAERDAVRCPAVSGDSSRDRDHRCDGAELRVCRSFAGATCLLAGAGRHKAGPRRPIEGSHPLGRPTSMHPPSLPSRSSPARSPGPKSVIHPPEGSMSSPRSSTWSRPITCAQFVEDAWALRSPASHRSRGRSGSAALIATSRSRWRPASSWPTAAPRRRPCGPSDLERDVGVVRIDPRDEHRGPAVPVQVGLGRGPSAGRGLVHEPVERERDPGRGGDPENGLVHILDRPRRARTHVHHVVDRIARVPPHRGSVEGEAEGTRAPTDDRTDGRGRR